MLRLRTQTLRFGILIERMPYDGLSDLYVITQIYISAFWQQTRLPHQQKS